MKKLLVGATLLVTVVAVKKRIAKKKPNINLTLGGREYESLAAQIKNESVVKPARLKVDEDFLNTITARSAFVK